MLQCVLTGARRPWQAAILQLSQGSSALQECFAGRSLRWSDLKYKPFFRQFKPADFPREGVEECNGNVYRRFYKSEDLVFSDERRNTFTKSSGKAPTPKPEMSIVDFTKAMI